MKFLYAMAFYIFYMLAMAFSNKCIIVLFLWETQSLMGSGGSKYTCEVIDATQ